MEELIVFAHKNEAQAFIQELCLKKDDSMSSLFFSNNKVGVLIIGQGLFEANYKLEVFFKHCTYSIKKIYNFGIAGRLNKTLKIDEVYPVKRVNLFKDNGCIVGYPFGDVPNAKRCVSSQVPISTRNIDDTIISCGDIVDMELWAVAQFASKKNIEVCAYKLISDDPTQPLDINKIKSKSSWYSKKLFTYYKNDKMLIDKEQ